MTEGHAPTATASTGDARRMYDAFISYSQRKDKPIAAALRSVIQTIGKPWWQTRNLRIFLDATSLSASPELWPSIVRALDQSRYLILLASREAAQSPWVDKEVSHWLATKGSATLLIALTDGELIWDEGARDFRGQDLPLPPSLKGKFPSEPLWVDLRGYREAPDRATKKDRDFLNRALDFAATIHGKPKEDLYSEELRQQRRNLGWAYSAAGSLAVLSVLAGVSAVAALIQREAAVQQRDAALVNQSRLLADAAHQEIKSGDAATGILLALAGLPNDEEGAGRPDVTETENMLLSGLMNLHEREILDGNTGAIYSPDSSKLAFATPARSVRVIDLKSKRELADLKHSEDLLSLSFSPDGKRIATQSMDNSIHIWDVASARELIAVKNQSGFNSVTFSPDGAKLLLTNRASSPESRGAMVWDTVALKRVLILPHPDEVVFGAFSEDGRLIATASNDKIARIFDAVTGKEKLSLRGHEGKINQVSFSPDGSLLVTASEDSTARIWRTSDGGLVHTLMGHQEAVWAANFSKDGERVVTTSSDDTVRVWTVERGAQVLLLKGQVKPITRGVALSYISAEFDRTGESLVTTHHDDTVRLWDLRKVGALTLDPNCTASRALGSADGALIVTSCNAEGALQVWDGASGKLLHRLDSKPGPIAEIILSPDANILAALGKDGVIRLWAPSEGRKIAELAHGKDLVSGVFDARGKKLATGSSDGVTKIWDLSALQSGTPIVLPQEVHEITRLAFSPSGDRLVAVLADLTGRVWDAASGKLLFELADGAAPELEPKQGSISAVAYSPDGQYIATGKEGATVLWDAATGKKLGAARTSYDTPILAASFSADGRRLISAGIDWQTWVGEVPSMRTIKYIDTMTYEPFAYDAAGDLMVTTAYGVQLNDATTGRQVGMLDGEFETATLSADGAHLYATNKDGKAYVWSLPPRGARRIAEARRLVPRCLTTLQLESAGLDPAPPRWCISGPDHVNEKDPTKWEAKWPYQTPEWREWLIARDRGEHPQLPNLPGGGPPSPQPGTQQDGPADAASAPETALPAADNHN